MKKAGKILLITLVFICLLLAAAVSLTIGWRPFVGPRARPTTNHQIERTPERLARGRYLTTGLVGCETCHSPKNWDAHGAPIVPGKELAGQVLPVPGLPGRIVASNLTPDPETGAARWSDDEILRAIREGIGHDGRTIFPMMPYSVYRRISDEDAASIVVYLRSVPPVRNALPPTEVKFPVNYLVRAAPEPLTDPVHGPDPLSDPVQRGKYLTSIGCGCHTPSDPKGPIPGLEFGGGEYLKGPWGEVTSANITPDPSGISYYDEALFIEAMRTGYVKARKLSSIMPFGEFQNLTDDDLKAIFAYLRTVKPVKHRVDNSLPPTLCKLCRQKHGAGDQNSDQNGGQT
jgi:mono/diheme cytochrome c family protein